jgi:inorganic phosphate transporter, PiT family
LDGVTAMLVLVVLLAIAFDYVNGFHDTANAIATSVATRALAPRYAILMATAFNFMITWQQGLPSSSSHALIGGLLGATIIAAGTGALNIDGIVNKVLIPMLTSPLLGFFIAFALMVGLYWVFRSAKRKPMAGRFRRLQIVSAAFMAFAHGSNDAQKTMGIITLALLSAGIIDDFTVPTWVIVVSATALSLGTAVGGWRIMHTMGQRVAKLEPVHGFAAETTAATILLGTAELGMPVSTTQVISGAIMGVGSSQGLRHVRWGVARRILVAWVLTLPAAGTLAALSWLALNAIGLS